jgi:uncharacterized protein YqiB (DUF1249 family)
MSTITRLPIDAPLRIPRLSRFGWLMGLYAENHQRLRRLFEPERLAAGGHVSIGRDGLDLRLDVIEQHPYTIELRLAYAQLRDGDTGQPDPSAFVRYYRDAQQAEVTHCYVGRQWQDVLGLHPPLSALIDHRLRMNVFFSKWLEYLGEQGHCWRSMRQAALPAVAGL